MKFILPLLSMACGLTVAHAEGKQPIDSIQHIDNVVVTGTRMATDVRHLPQTITIVGRDALTENHRENILPTLTEQVPNLLVTSRGMMGYGVSTGAAGGMMLRGISSGQGQMMVLIDGHPQYNGVYGHSIADSYQTMMAERVEVLRGPASMIYGSNAMGGVINIVTRGMKENGCQTEVNLGAGSYGTIEAEVANQFRHGRFSSTIALQYGRTDNHRPNMGFEQYGGYLKLGYEISSHWNAFADIDITHFNASNPGTLSSPKEENDQWITRYAGNFVIENHYDNLFTASGIPVLTSGALSVYDNAGRHKINDGYNPNSEKPKDALFRSKDAVEGVSVYQSLTYQWSNPTTITAGFDFQHIYGRAWYTNRETGEVVTTKQRLMQSCHAHENEMAGYIEARQEIARIITLDAGIRLDYHTVAGTEAVPQVGIAVRPMSNAEVKLSASKGFRNPTTKEMFLYGTANSDSLHAERMWSYELSWRHHLLSDRLTYGINLFLIHADNIIQAVNNRNINTGEIKNRGVEFDAQWTINNHWSVNTNHSWLHMDQHVISAPEYKGYIGGSWHSGRWSVNAGLMQVCGLFTAIGKAEKKTSFTLLNATVNYKPCRILTLWAKGDNLLAQRYQYLDGMPMPRATFMGGVNLRF